LEYHKTMRRWLIIFMLFLLPIRVLVGDAMAYSMLPAAIPASGEAAQSAMNTVAAYAHMTRTTSTFEHENIAHSTAKPPCHMEMSAADASNDTDATQSQCTTCQACHLSAAIPMQLPGGILHTTAAAPSQRSAHWISADLRLLAKTPVL
jgi:hypothetical protein